jgi:glycosyltransferase involved in cell wall biosynthesis
MTTATAALYICYFGLREPLVQTQVLPYLRELVSGGVRLSLLTFEPEMKKRWTETSIAEWRQRLRSDGVEWHMLPYHKRPSLPATIFDIVNGGLRAAAIARREHIDIFHGRSHVGAAIGELAKRLKGGRVIFDVRGLLAEEYVESGNWPAGGILFRLTKAAERWLLRSADAFVVLTERARETLFADADGRPLEVIPCCVSMDRFADALGRDRDKVRAELGLSGRLVFVYAGSLGGYYLTRETADFLAAARDADPRLYALVLTQGSPAPMVEELERRGFSRDDYRVMQVPPDEVPTYLRASDAGLSFIQPSNARQSSSPTKFAEYLAAGLPVVVTAGIGDLDAHVEEGRVGVLLRRHDRSAYDDAFRAVEDLRRDPQLAERCRGEARARYDLQTIGGARYRRLYRAVMGIS